MRQVLHGFFAFATKHHGFRSRDRRYSNWNHKLYRKTKLLRVIANCYYSTYNGTVVTVHNSKKTLIYLENIE